jgi:uncharacterized membrane protein YgcG
MTVSVPTTQQWRAIVQVLVMTALIMGALPRASSANAAEVAMPSLRVQATSEAPIPERPPGSTTFVYDEAGVLDEAAAERHQFDLGRLFDAGVPTIIFTRRSADSRIDAVAFADRLRSEWNIESAPGVDDGIVILVSLHESSRAQNALVVSTGRNALPINQLTSETLREIYETEMLPAFRRNEINLALAFGVRRILYYEGYTPPDPAPLSSRQETAQTLASGVLILTGLLAIAGPLLTRWRGLRHRLRLRRLYPVALALSLVVAAGLAVYGRSERLLALAVLGGAALLLVNRLTATWRTWRHSDRRDIRVRPRGRRTGSPAILAHRRSPGPRHG